MAGVDGMNESVDGTDDAQKKLGTRLVLILLVSNFNSESCLIFLIFKSPMTICILCYMYKHITTSNFVICLYI